jgi:hypothetical protein
MSEAVTWWTPAEFAVVMQELKRHTFRRKALRRAMDKFQDVMGAAKGRRIPFLLTFHEWWTIWQESGHWGERGLNRHRYQMARFGTLALTRSATSESSRDSKMPTRPLVYPGLARHSA